MEFIKIDHLRELPFLLITVQSLSRGKGSPKAEMTIVKDGEKYQLEDYPL